jgi:membrane-associated phospholipid phosphatase
VKITPNFSTRFISSVALFAWIIVAYTIPNQFVLFPTTNVPLTTVDTWIPLSAPWTWIYISYYPFIYFAYFAARSSGNAKRYLFMMAALAFVSMLIFIFFPTEIIREPYPLVGDDFSTFALATIRNLDNSVNCLPSMHIAMSCMAAYTYASESKTLGIFGFVWALLIAYSTMATKQHYFLDVIGGVGLATTMVLAFKYFGRDRQF